MIDRIQDIIANENRKISEERDRSLASANRWRAGAFTLWCTTWLMLLACFIICLGLTARAKLAEQREEAWKAAAGAVCAGDAIEESNRDIARGSHCVEWRWPARDGFGALTVRNGGSDANEKDSGVSAEKGAAMIDGLEWDAGTSSDWQMLVRNKNIPIGMLNRVLGGWQWRRAFRTEFNFVDAHGLARTKWGAASALLRAVGAL